MALVSSREMLLKAQKEGYALGAFNVENMEMVQAVIEAAEEMRSPVMIQTTSGTLKYATPDMYASMVRAMAEKASVPVCMHLDHGDSVETAKKCMEAGYTSLMIDGSKLDFEANIAITREVVEMAGDLPIEAELGTVGGKEDGHSAEAQYTEPDKAVEFVKRTGISSLAVAIGTAHGIYKGEPKLDINRLAEIRKVVDIPLVLHGTSGVPEDAVRACIKEGICKVNYATDLRIAYTNGVRALLAEKPEAYDPKAFGKVGRAEVKKVVCDRIRLVGSDGKA
ncbi:MAG: class II fructose-bisphosphate aldolase [Clostridia bacterium]|nr:class II fructose-bisphosphate aldolase [Clostridia bacterium]